MIHAFCYAISGLKSRLAQPNVPNPGHLEHTKARYGVPASVWAWNATSQAILSGLQKGESAYHALAGSAIIPPDRQSDCENQRLSARIAGQRNRPRARPSRSPRRATRFQPGKAGEDRPRRLTSADRDATAALFVARPTRRGGGELSLPKGSINPECGLAPRRSPISARRHHDRRRNKSSHSGIRFRLVMSTLPTSGSSRRQAIFGCGL